jgi:hypothetical protein
MIVNGRMIVGSGWMVCECDKPKEKIVDKSMEKSRNDKPFIFTSN